MTVVVKEKKSNVREENQIVEVEGEKVVRISEKRVWGVRKIFQMVGLIQQQ